MAITNIKDIQKRLASGLGFYMPFVTENTPGAGGWNQGQVEGSLTPRIQGFYGSTYPGTLLGIPIIGGGANTWLTGGVAGSNANAPVMYGFFYKIGTFVTTATGNQFTHDAATFPMTRTYFGEVTKPVCLIPFVQVTTAITITDPRYRLQTAAGGAGYVNQDGASVVGANSCGWIGVTKPSGFATNLYLNDLDCAVQDIIQIRIDTASTAGACTIWGFEPMIMLGCFDQGMAGYRDGVFAGMQLTPMSPASTTGGSSTNFFGGVGLMQPDNVCSQGVLWGVKD